MARPQPGFYVLRFKRGAALATALIYQPCPMVMPQPTTVDGPDPEDWCRPLDRSRSCHALIDGKPANIDRVWTARSLQPITPDEYAFRLGQSHRRVRQHSGSLHGQFERPVDLTTLPPLF